MPQELSKNVPNASNSGKRTSVSKNRLGQPEQTVDTDGEVKQVLNELPADGSITPFVGGRRGKYAQHGLGQLGDDNIPDTHSESRGCKMSQIHETDCMKSMAGKTDRLGAKPKNTGGSFEKLKDSTHGDPGDDCCTQVHNGQLGGKQKNTGGTFEELADSKHSEACDGIQDCGTMAGDLGQNNQQTNKGGQFEPLKGSKNKMSEAWGIDNIAAVMEGQDIDLQQLFDSYADQTQVVTLEEFQLICRAHGVTGTITEGNLEALMNANRSYLFHFSEDASGTFWVSSILNESAPEVGQRPFDQPKQAGCVACDGTGKSSDGGTCLPCKGRGAAQKVEGHFAPKPATTGNQEVTEELPDVGPEDDRLRDINIDDDNFQDMDMPGASEDGLGMDGRMDTQRPNLMDRAKSLGRRILGQQADMQTPDMQIDDGMDGMQMDEMGTSSAGVAAPPMGKAMSMGTANKRMTRGRFGASADQAKPGGAPDDLGQDLSLEHCTKCGGIVDEVGCLECALTETMADPVSAKANKDGYYTSDATQKGKGSLSSSVPKAATQSSKSEKADDNITDEMGGKGKTLNSKQTNSGGQFEPLKGGSKACRRISHD